MTMAGDGGTGLRPMPHEGELTFIERAPASSLTESDVRFILERLTRGPDGVFDVSEGGARVVAALLERSESDANCATLLILGIEGAAAERARAFGRLVDAARDVAAVGPRVHLRVPLPPPITALEPALVARGFAPLFVSFTMRTPDASVHPAPVTAYDFVDWTPSMGAAHVRDVVMRAFAGAPDLILMSVEDLHARLCEARPTPRLLFDGPELVGVCRTSGPSSDGVGRVVMIARDPVRRGGRLGDVLLVEAERVLASAGATRFELEVATQNASALGLYARHGFVVDSEEITWSLDLRASMGRSTSP